MKKLLVALAFLLTLGVAKAITYNCTEIGQQIVIPDCICTPGECPPCPEPWNITIENITIPNITCSYDTSGFTESMGECIRSLSTCRDNLQECDIKISTQKLQNQSLLECQSDLSKARTQVKAVEDQWKQYCVIAFAFGLGVMWWYWSEKQKPAGVLSRMERE